MNEITASGKKLQVFVGCLDEVEKTLSYVETPESVAFIGAIQQQDEERLMRIMKRYDA